MKNKKILIGLAATTGAAAYTIAKAYTKYTDKPKRKTINLINPQNSAKWSPLEIVASADDKPEVAAKLAKYILNTVTTTKEKFFYNLEVHLLKSAMLYVLKKGDTSFTQVYDMIAEMAALGSAYEYPDDECFREINLMKDRVKQDIAEALLIDLESFGCERIRDILKGGDITLKEFLSGKYDIKIIDGDIQSPLVSLLEKLIIETACNKQWNN